MSAGQFSANMSSTVRKVVSTLKAPKAIGPYNQAIIANNTMYISGQLGLNPETMEFDSNDTVEQAKRALNNLGAILESQSANFTNVVKTTVLLASMEDYKAVNDVYATFFKPPYPARAAFAVKDLPKYAKVEIEAIAIVGKIEDQ